MANLPNAFTAVRVNEHFLQHRDDGDSILRSDSRRGAAYHLIQFDRDNVRFFPLENSANTLLDGFSVGDDAARPGTNSA
jgi:hypothetical protein